MFAPAAYAAYGPAAYAAPVAYAAPAAYAAPYAAPVAYAAAAPVAYSGAVREDTVVAGPSGTVASSRVAPGVAYLG